MMGAVRFMIVEHFLDGDPVPVYRRFAERAEAAEAVASRADAS